MCFASSHKGVIRSIFALLLQTTSKLGKTYETMVDFETLNRGQLRTETLRDCKQSVSYNHSTLQPEHSFLTAVRVVETQAEPVV